MTRRIRRIIADILYWWRRRHMRTPAPIATLSDQLARARKAHKPTARILAQLKRERIEGLKLEVGR